MNMTVISIAILAAVAGAAVYFFVIRKKTISTGSATPVGSTGWTIQYSPGMPTQMTKASDGSYFVDLPTQDGLHYVVEKAPRLQLGQLVTLSFNVSGTGTIVPVQGTTAKVSLYMQRAGDNMSGTGAYQQYRYWHNYALLGNGDGTLSATLTPDQWGDVFGARGTEHQQGFQACVANAAVIGFTFGDPGAGATGHGVYVKGGSARFTLKSFTIA